MYCPQGQFCEGVKRVENEEIKSQEEKVQSEKPVKKTGKGKKFLLIIGGIIILLLILGGKGGNKSQQGSSTTTKESVATPTPTPMQITARQLADDFDASQVSAEAKWNGKLIEFSAVISNITDNGLSFSDVASEDFSFTQISCRIKNKEQLLPLKNGQTVTVRGVVGKQTIGVIDVNDCEVVGQ